MVPRAAVLRRSEVTAVYVVDDKGEPRLRQVRSAPSSDEHPIEVLAGLKAGEKVALEPVKAGMAAGAARLSRMDGMGISGRIARYFQDSQLTPLDRAGGVAAGRLRRRRSRRARRSRRST